MRSTSLGIVTLAAALYACVGTIGEGAGDGTNAPTDPSASSDTASGTAGSTVLRRLTRQELARTIEDLFGRIIDLEGMVPADPRVQGLERNADALGTTSGHVDVYVALAEQLANDADLTALTKCGTLDRACVQTFLGTFGRRAYRRPLTAEERTSYLAAWDGLATAYDGEFATRGLLARLLQSPDFLYHVELGSPDGALRPYELASRLSYLLWESMPDDALLDAAEQGRLATSADLEREATRMLASPRAKATLKRFVGQWLDIDALDNVTKDPSKHPDFQSMKPLLRREFDTFVDDVVSSRGGVGALLGANYTFANSTLAPLYGATAAGDAFQKVALDPNQRSGVLTQGAILSVHGKADRSAPIMRGVFVLERMLCSPVGAPPPGVSTIPTEAPTGGTTREFFANLTSRDTCMSCHRSINSVGFGFEDFDEIGRFRTQEGSLPIDASGSVPMGDQAGDFSGGAALGRKLAASTTVRRCVATQWFRWSYERLEAPGDAPIIDEVDKALAEGGLAALPLSIVKSPWFRTYHRTATGGGS